MVERAAAARRDDYRAWRRFAMRWADNDAYGHVNNVVFYAWFDSAVNAWLVEQGLLDVAAGDPIALVVETGCTYFAPLAFPGEVEVGIAVERLGRSSIHYRVGVFASGEDVAAAQGRFVHVVVGRETRSPVAVPDAWRRKLEQIS